MTTLCIGSSHVRRFHQFIGTHRSSSEVFNIELLPQVSFFGIGGAKVSSPRHLQEFGCEIQRIKPVHLIVHFGGNDLDSVEYSVDITIHGLIAWLTRVRRINNLSSITIIRLLPRPVTRYISALEYTDRVLKANALLKEQCAEFNFTYWRLKGFTNCTDNIFLDGVHLNSYGMRKYYRQMWGILLKNQSNRTSSHDDSYPYSSIPV